MSFVIAILCNRNWSPHRLFLFHVFPKWNLIKASSILNILPLVVDVNWHWFCCFVFLIVTIRQCFIWELVRNANSEANMVVHACNPSNLGYRGKKITTHQDFLSKEWERRKKGKRKEGKKERRKEGRSLVKLAWYVPASLKKYSSIKQVNRV